MTKTQKLKAIAQVFRDEVERIRSFDRELNEGTKYKFSDACADVRITVEDNMVRVTYDGAGYDYFSSQSMVENPMTGRMIYYGEQQHDKLNKKIQEIDPNLYIEDCNSWSLGVWL